MSLLKSYLNTFLETYRFRKFTSGDIVQITHVSKEREGFFNIGDTGVLEYDERLASWNIATETGVRNLYRCKVEKISEVDMWIQNLARKPKIITEAQVRLNLTKEEVIWLRFVIFETLGDPKYGIGKKPSYMQKRFWDALSHVER